MIMFDRTYFSPKHSSPQCSKFLLFKFQKEIREFKPTLWIGLVEESSRSWLLHNTVGLKSWLVIQKSWTNLGFCFDEIGESNLGTKKFKRQRSCIIGRIQLKYIVTWKNISIFSKIKIPSTNANHYGIFLPVVVLFYCENYLDLEVLYSHQHQYCVVLCAHKSKTLKCTASRMGRDLGIEAYHNTTHEFTNLILWNWNLVLF